jgi:hypothetical protein
MLRPSPESGSHSSSEQGDVKTPYITADDRDRYFIDRAVEARKFRCMPQFWIIGRQLIDRSKASGGNETEWPSTPLSYIRS